MHIIIQPSTSDQSPDNIKASHENNTTSHTNYRTSRIFTKTSYTLLALILMHWRCVACKSLYINNKHSNNNHQLNAKYYTCRDPPDLADRLMQWMRDAAFTSGDELPGDFAPNRDFKVYDDRDNAICLERPDSLTERTSEDLMHRALCPWEWRPNRDVERQPQLISEARCMCRHARGSVDAQCMPIHRTFPVLRRLSCDLSTGYYDYARVYETITVGCHSVAIRRRRAEHINQHLLARLNGAELPPSLNDY